MPRSPVPPPARSPAEARAHADRIAIERWEGEGGRPLPASSKSDRGSGSAPQRLRTLLVPLDLSPRSDRVVARLPLLPLAADARITLLHVVPDGLPPGQERTAVRDARITLSAELRRLRQSMPKRATLRSLVAVGTVAAEISSFARRTDAELIVMGRGGRHALHEVILGSTAERVIRQTQLPVLVVRLPARTPYQRPALAIDIDQAVPEVVRLLLLVLSPSRLRVALIHAYNFPYGGTTYPSLSAAQGAKVKAELRFQASRAVATALASALARLKVGPEDGPTWKTYVQDGSPRRVVEKIATRTRTDLLLLGTRGHPAVVSAFLGTVAGDLLRQVGCDVLVVPPARSRRKAAAPADTTRPHRTGSR